MCYFSDIFPFLRVFPAPKFQKLTTILVLTFVFRTSFNLGVLLLHQLDHGVQEIVSVHLVVFAKFDGLLHELDEEVVHFFAQKSNSKILHYFGAYFQKYGPYSAVGLHQSAAHLAKFGVRIFQRIRFNAECALRYDVRAESAKNKILEISETGSRLFPKFPKFFQNISKVYGPQMGNLRICSFKLSFEAPPGQIFKSAQPMCD